MIKKLSLLAIILGTLVLYSCKKTVIQPNIIYILADDLGYGELGVYGQKKIETPYLDKLAARGMLFNNYYSGAPVCAPARCVLLTGKHSGHAYIRGNDEWRERGDVWDFAKMAEDPNLEGQRPLPNGTVTLGNIMQEAGYKTAIIGKWGLGAPLTESVPTNRGFDFFFGYNCQRQAHTYFPLHLWKNTEKVLLNNKMVAPNTKLPEGADPMDENSYADFWLEDYAPAVMQEEAIGFIRENRDQPFFLYYATPIPHVPLQAPEKWVKYYVEKFGDEEPYIGDQGYFPCRYPKATYAAMVSYLDEQVGELIAELKELDLYKNTMIIFTSDNGPSYTGGTDSPWFNSGGLFKSEKGWGKGSVHEGGIRIPMIASWPGRIAESTTSGHVSSFYDVMPTFCELTGITPPEGTDGMSFLPIMMGNGMQKTNPYYYWEFPAYGGQVAIRMGKWKAIAFDLQNTDEITFELYDLSRDSREQNNLADKHPDLIKQFLNIVQNEHEQAEIEKFRIKALGDKI